MSSPDVNVAAALADAGYVLLPYRGNGDPGDAVDGFDAAGSVTFVVVVDGDQGEGGVDVLVEGSDTGDLWLAINDFTGLTAADAPATFLADVPPAQLRATVIGSAKRLEIRAFPHAGGGGGSSGFDGGTVAHTITIEPAGEDEPALKIADTSEPPNDAAHAQLFSEDGVLKVKLADNSVVEVGAGGGGSMPFKLVPFGPFTGDDLADDNVLIYTPTGDEKVLAAIFDDPAAQAPPTDSYSGGPGAGLVVGTLGVSMLGLDQVAPAIQDTFGLIPAQFGAFGAFYGLPAATAPVYAAIAENGLGSPPAGGAWQANTDYEADAVKTLGKAYDVLALGQVWFNAGAAGTSGDDEPDFASILPAAITAVDNAGPSITVAGDQTARFTNGATFNVEGTSGTGGNDGQYTVASTSVVMGNTVIETIEPVNDGGAGGVAFLPAESIADGPDIAWKWQTNCPSDGSMSGYLIVLTP